MQTIPQPTTREAVRGVMCPLCWSAADGTPCQRRPPGDHLARWLAAYKEGTVSREQLKAAVRNLIVMDAYQVIDERGVA